MALAVVHVGGQATTGTSTVTSDSWTSTAGSDIIVVGHTFADNGAATNGDITDAKSNTYTLLTSTMGGGSDIGIAVWHSNNTTRGASHTVTYNPTAGAGGESLNLAVIEITGQDQSSDYDSTTANTHVYAVGTTPANITASAAISGNQIAIYAETVNSGDNVAFTQPTGYTNILNQPNGVSDLVSDAAYKINETGTPTVGAARTIGSTTGNRVVFVTFKEATTSAFTAPPIERVMQAVRRAATY